MNGLCIEFRYSKSRPGSSVMRLWRGLKKLDHMKIDMSLDNLAKPKLNQPPSHFQIKMFF